MPTRRHPRYEKQERARHLHWSLKSGLLAVIAFACYTVHICVSSSKHAIHRLPAQNKALVEYPPLIPETRLASHLDAYVSQSIRVIQTLLPFSYIPDLLPSTFATELKNLEHNINSLIYFKSHLAIDTEFIVFQMYTTQRKCFSIDVSFKKYQPDPYHNLKTLICVYIQDLINEYYHSPLSANHSVSRPFYSSRETAALLKRKLWSTSIGHLIDSVHPALTELTIIIPQLSSAAVSINLLISHLVNLTAQSTPLHSHFSAIRALLNLSPPLLKPPTSIPAFVNLTAALEVAANTARTTAHLLVSVNASVTALHTLEQTLQTGPWRNTHIITAEQWTAQEKEMRRWKLKAADETMRLNGFIWEADIEGKEYSWFFGAGKIGRMEVKGKRG